MFWLSIYKFYLCWYYSWLSNIWQTFLIITISDYSTSHMHQIWACCGCQSSVARPDSDAHLLSNCISYWKGSFPKHVLFTISYSHICKFLCPSQLISSCFVTHKHERIKLLMSRTDLNNAPQEVNAISTLVHVNFWIGLFAGFFGLL